MEREKMGKRGIGRRKWRGKIGTKQREKGEDTELG